MWIDLWPASSITVRRSTPAITRRLINVWRRSCQRKSFRPESSIAGSNQLRGLWRTWTRVSLVRSQMPNDSGLQRVIRNGKAGDALWPHDQRHVTNTGIVHYEADVDVTVVSTIPDTHQRWDKNYPGPGFTSPSEPGASSPRTGTKARRGRE